MQKIVAVLSPQPHNKMYFPLFYLISLKLCNIKIFTNNLQILFLSVIK